MSQEEFQTFMQNERALVKSKEGFAKALLADAKKENLSLDIIAKLQAEIEQLRQQQPIYNNIQYTFNAPVAQAIGNVEQNSSLCQPSPSPTTSTPPSGSTLTT